MVSYQKPLGEVVQQSRQTQPIPAPSLLTTAILVLLPLLTFWVPYVQWCMVCAHEGIYVLFFPCNNVTWVDMGQRHRGIATVVSFAWFLSWPHLSHTSIVLIIAHINTTLIQRLHPFHSFFSTNPQCACSESTLESTDTLISIKRKRTQAITTRQLNQQNKATSTKRLQNVHHYLEACLCQHSSTTWARILELASFTQTAYFKHTGVVSEVRLNYISRRGTVLISLSPLNSQSQPVRHLSKTGEHSHPKKKTKKYNTRDSTVLSKRHTICS